jgi:hypothetical protein
MRLGALCWIQLINDIAHYVQSASPRLEVMYLHTFKNPQTAVAIAPLVWGYQRLCLSEALFK